MKNQKTTSARNCTIDILRLFFAIEIVALHTSPLVEYNAIISYLLTQTISRLAVPFFSAIAGYYYFANFESDKKIQSLKRYISLYSFWSFIMYIFEALRWKKSFIAFIKQVFIWYFLQGWHQLWYLLAIIYTLILLFIMNSLLKISFERVYQFSFVFLAIGIMFHNYGNLFLKFPLMHFFKSYNYNMIQDWLFMLFPFFMLGYALNKPKKTYNQKRYLLLTMLCIMGLIIEVFITTIFNLHYKVIVCLFTYPIIFNLVVWALQNPYYTLDRMARKCSYYASIIYYSHYLFLLMFLSYGYKYTTLFVLCLGSSTIIGFLYRIMKKHIKIIFT